MKIHREHKMTTQTFAISGMTCGGCVKSVQNALAQIEGVNSVHVSLEQHNAVIEFDESKTNTQALAEAIEDAGFDVTV